jgi:hypothetical protein
MKPLLPLETLFASQDRTLRKDGYLTFNGWSQRGMRVKPGARSQLRNSNGVALFHESQVYDPDSHRGGLLDTDDDYDPFNGDPWSLHS